MDCQKTQPATKPGIPRGLKHVPRNAWYVVAGRDELGETLLSRRALGVPLVLFRTSEGEPIALFDRCPHRLMPLSLGNRLGDEIQCIYHGIQFDSEGVCTKIPTQDSIPKKMVVRKYPLVEKGMFTWIWMGDEDKMDPALIPDPGHVPAGYSNIFHFTHPVRCDFIRMQENLMDTSHPSFLHAGLFDDGQLATAPYKYEIEGNVVRLTRDMGIFVPGPGTASFWGIEPGTRVHQTSVSETHAPSFNNIINTFTFPDDPTREPRRVVTFNPVLPGDEGLCYAVMANATSWPVSPSPDFDAFMRSVLEGDIIAMEAIEPMLDAMGPEDAEVSIRADAPSLGLRQLIASMAAAEQRTA